MSHDRAGAGAVQGRRDADQITLFKSVGLAIEDFSALRHVSDQLKSTGLSRPAFIRNSTCSPTPTNRDLLGKLLRAAQRG